MDLQELLALSVVLVVFVSGVRRAFYSFFAAPLSEWLLRKGRVKWAVWVRKKSLTKKGSDRCHSVL